MVKIYRKLMIWYIEIIFNIKAMHVGGKLSLNKGAIKGFLGLILGLLVLTGCKSTRMESDPQRFQELQALVNNRDFTIKFQWAHPQRGGMIDLSSNPNEFTIDGDMVNIFLPYFGVRHRGGGYNQNKGGISYKGRISDLQISEDVSRGNIILEFSAKEDSERFNFLVTMFNNGKAQVNVSSSDRESILYHGGEVRPSSELRKE